LLNGPMSKYYKKKVCITINKAIRITKSVAFALQIILITYDLHVIIIQQSSKDFTTSKF